MCPFKIIGKWSEPTTSGVSYVMPMRMCQYCALRKIICFVAPLICIHDDVSYSYPHTSLLHQIWGLMVTLSYCSCWVVVRVPREAIYDLVPP